MKTWRFWRHYFVKCFAVLGTIVASIRIWLLFFPGHSQALGGIGFISAVAVSVVTAFVVTWPRPIECDYSTPETKIKIKKGDIFQQDEDHLVIGVCNTFDTKIPEIIEKKTLLGQAIDHLYGSDYERLDTDLDSALKGKTPIEPLTKSGKTVRYEIGTVAVVRNQARKIFFSAYSEMDSNNSASSQIEGLTKSLFELWNEVIASGNCRPISITPWGGGPSRISNILPAQDSIRLIILSFMFASRKKKVSDQLTVVVPPAVFKKLDRLELQAFISSLRGS
ncbi:macro domain-containing protein [Stenotrophomonas maltophilia]|uniref:macro domain-containing protein n=1 Tax=Stenotrophomonas maltophilia TaxID=40324 RepID=UPI0034D71D90